MRLPLIDPTTLSGSQRDLYEDMKEGIESGFNSFRAINDDGALIGPWNPMLRYPRLGGPTWELIKAISNDSQLPANVREIAILVTGTHYDAAYELYAHVAAAESKGMDPDCVASIVAGTRPDSLSKEERVAYDTAHALNESRLLPRPVYDRAVEAFGDEGAAELIYLIGLYCMVSVMLNGFNVQVPDYAT
ncbi:hypothetical protein PARPLA_02909 [Rhodobacteraceae bacterium THAF1]|nr:hypothetical protein FIU81_06455 [Palleronia sp. THAF1]VDC28939.1 hypothetical protein PARPLA_02909 [Rhodobacteraceae bacterium THAF1]